MMTTTPNKPVLMYDILNYMVVHRKTHVVMFFFAHNDTAACKVARAFVRTTIAAGKANNKKSSATTKDFSLHHYKFKSKKGGK